PRAGIDRAALLESASLAAAENQHWTSQRHHRCGKRARPAGWRHDGGRCSHLAHCAPYCGRQDLRKKEVDKVNVQENESWEGASRAIGRFVEGFRLEALREAHYAAVGRALVDTVSVAFAGHNEPAAAIARSYLAGRHGPL